MPQQLDIDCNAGGLDGVEAIAAIEERRREVLLLFEDGDGSAQPVLTEVLAELAQLVRGHQREQVGGGMDRQNVAPGRRRLPGGGHGVALRFALHTCPSETCA